ncbi:unnamed protein product, partial [Scytosiphon promiscuus]
IEQGEEWVADSGCTYHTTGDPRLMYNMQCVPPEESRIAPGDGRVLNVVGKGSLNLIMHAQTEFPVTLQKVLLVEGMHFNLFRL